MMMRNVVLSLFAFFILSSNTHVREDSKNKLKKSNEEISNFKEMNHTDSKSYNDLYLSFSSEYKNFPKYEVLKLALDGFYHIRNKGYVEKEIITIIDFSVSSNIKRLWVIDIEKGQILFNSLVAHGRNSGDEFANNFSNKAESYQSSLGFYATGEVYQGKHGFSLKLDGLEKGLNDKARDRAVVMHGADYVAESFIKKHNRLGRSLGCPAIPNLLTKDIINTIKDKSCLFIYHQKAYHPTFSIENLNV